MNIRDFKASLDYLTQAELTPFIWGHAGIGKSSIVKQYAQDKGYHFFPFYLGTQSDLGDILGLADFVRDANGTAVATTFATPKWLRDTIVYCEENPTSGAIIFLDEFNRARKDILNGMFSLALDKTFHTLKLPNNCYIIAAGNPPTDEYFTTDVDETALMARFVHVKLEPTFEEWTQYAEKRGIEATLVGFLKGQPQMLEQARSEFDLPVKADRRSYERLSRLFEANTPSHLLNQLMPGIIGMERTVAYQQYLEQSDRPLMGEQILDNSKIAQIKKWCKKGDVQASYLNLSCENLEKHFKLMADNKSLLTAEQKVNLYGFFSTVPKDISFPSIIRMVEEKNPAFMDFITDSLYAQPMVKFAKTCLAKEK